MCISCNKFLNEDEAKNDLKNKGSDRIFCCYSFSCFYLNPDSIFKADIFPTLIASIEGQTVYQ